MAVDLNRARHIGGGGIDRTALALTVLQTIPAHGDGVLEPERDAVSKMRTRAADVILESLA